MTVIALPSGPFGLGGDDGRGLEPPDAEAAFWDARPELAHIHRIAQARRAAPWSTLGTMLVHVLHQVPPDVVLPPLVGTYASLNLYLALVGESGQGKDTSDGAADGGLAVGKPTRKIPMGTGEGIVKNYVTYGEDPATGEAGMIQYETAAVVTASEVDKVAAISGRRGATLTSFLRDAWTGKQLGSGNSGPEHRLWVEAHRYRLGVVVGVQPRRGEALLNKEEIAGGTPQRFLWLPCVDPGAPDAKPDYPGRLKWELPELPGLEPGSGLRVVPVCQAAVDEIDAVRLRRLRGEKVDLESHAQLNREKWACALGLLNGRAEIREEDWQLADVLLRVSDRTRQAVVDSLASEAAKANRAKGVAEAERLILVTEKVDDAAVRRACDAVARKLARGDGWTWHADLRRALKSSERQHFEEAVERLESAGRVIVETVAHRSGMGRRYRLSDGP